MPVITIELSTLTKEKKETLVKEMVTAASKTLNIPEQAFTMFIKENSLDNIARGTQLLSETHK